MPTFGTSDAAKQLDEFLAGPYKQYQRTIARFFNDSTRLFSQIGAIKDPVARIELLHIVLESRQAKWKAKKLPKELSSFGANALSALYRARLESYRR